MGEVAVYPGAPAPNSVPIPFYPCSSPLGLLSSIAVTQMGKLRHREDFLNPVVFREPVGSESQVKSQDKGPRSDSPLIPTTPVPPKTEQQEKGLRALKVGSGLALGPLGFLAIS